MPRYCQLESCKKELINPTPATKFCKECAKERQSEKVKAHMKRKRALQREARKRANEKLKAEGKSVKEISGRKPQSEIKPNKPVNPYFLTRGKLSNSGERRYVN